MTDPRDGQSIEWVRLTSGELYKVSSGQRAVWHGDRVVVRDRDGRTVREFMSEDIREIGEKKTRTLLTIGVVALTLLLGVLIVGGSVEPYS